MELDYFGLIKKIKYFDIGQQRYTILVLFINDIYLILSGNYWFTLFGCGGFFQIVLVDYANFFYCFGSFFFFFKGAKDHVWGAEEIFIGYKLKYLLTTILFFKFQGAIGPMPSNSSILDEQFEEFFFKLWTKILSFAALLRAFIQLVHA